MLYKTFDVIFFESLSLKLKCNEEFYNVSCHRQRIVNQNSTEWILVEYNCYWLLLLMFDQPLRFNKNNKNFFIFSSSVGDFAFTLTLFLR